MIRTLAISPYHSVQGEFEPRKVRLFQTGEMVGNGEGWIESLGHRFFGRPIEQVRHPAGFSSLLTGGPTAPAHTSPQADASGRLSQQFTGEPIEQAKDPGDGHSNEPVAGTKTERETR